MALSWNEIKDRALAFSKEWATAQNEDAEAKQFLVEFFHVFGISNRKVSTFEHRVKRLDASDGYIDLLWKGTILVEMKSKGKNLDRAFAQATEYLHGLKDHELPRYILVSDFFEFRLYDLESDTKEDYLHFRLPDLVHNVQHFGALIGYQKKIFKEQDPANIKAAELMGKLHDRLKEIGYDGHALEVYLVRLLFCLFAEDTAIFTKQQFQDFIEQRTSIDGSDLAARLQELFQVLNTPETKRFKNLDEQLAEFPYVNGKLFDEFLPIASFDSKMRLALLDCCYQDWSKISPDIFGSMFQSVMNPVERRNLGAHYTSETNVLKIIKPLFLDELRTEFESCKSNKTKLQEFHRKLASLKFLDPACGCGNILVITYRELRLLELDILRVLYKNKIVTSIETIVYLDVDMMYGIEYEEFPARIAEVAMWLIDHQMNMLISIEFGKYFARLPLKKAATIVHGNALQIDWENVVPKKKLSYILGNPPFVGRPYRSALQRNDHDVITKNIPQGGDLDFVANWFILAARFIKGTLIKVGFVSTNSICQGVQISLWSELIYKLNIKIHFAHQTFNWKNEARGNAAVHVVIIGFANYDITNKQLFLSPQDDLESHVEIVRNISPYLLPGSDLIVMSRPKPICNVKEIVLGSQPTDDGNFMFTKEEKQAFVQQEPSSEKYFRRVFGSAEFINNIERYCLWLVGAAPNQISNNPQIRERIENVRRFRLKSEKAATREDANKPSVFQMIRHIESDYLLIPRVSSVNRKFVPIGFVSKDIISTDANYIIPNATLYDFGMLQSSMHNAWLKVTAGKLKSDFRYSARLVYNNFPWPENPTPKQINAIEVASQKVLNARLEFPTSTLADLYNFVSMPPILVKAHNELDKAVDNAYRAQPFVNEANRMVFLFELYERYVGGMFVSEKKKPKRKDKQG